MSKWWNEIDWRCIQMNFREIDMLDVETDKIIESLKEFNATVFMINTGGIIASYDTNLPFHHKSEFLKGDSLKDIIDACHKENIRVIARMDFSKIREDIFKMHPEWAFRTPNNDVVNYNGNISACLNGGYQQEAIFDILGEVIDMLHVDGFYFNMPGLRVFDYDLNFHGLCHCDSCKTKLHNRFGINIPEFTSVKLPTKITNKELVTAGRTPDMFKYAQFQNEEEQKLTHKLRSFIRSKDENCAIMNVDFKRSESNAEVGAELPRLVYHASMQTRMNLGINQDMVSSNTSVDFLGFAFRHISVSPALQKLRLWQTLANFGGLDYYLIGRIDNHLDKTAFNAVKKVFNFRAEHEKIYANLINQAKVLLIHNSHPQKASHEVNGWVIALTENHIPFAEVHQSLITDANLDKYDVIISEGEISKQISLKLESFVAQGGTLLLSGKLASDEKTKELVGVKEHEVYDRDMRSCMFVVNEQEHKVFKNLAETEVVFFGTKYDKHIYQGGVDQLLKVSSPQRFGPPEMVYGSGVDNYPGITVNTYQKGRVLYVPAEVGSTYFREGWENTGLFMADVLLNVIELRSLAPQLSKTAEVTLGYNKDNHYDIVQVINANGFFGSQVYDPTPIHNVDLIIPVKDKIKAVKQLSNNQSLAYELKDQFVSIHVDQIDEYEAIIIEYK